jgi:hypothetical protein
MKRKANQSIREKFEDRKMAIHLSREHLEQNYEWTRSREKSTLRPIQENPK